MCFSFNKIFLFIKKRWFKIYEDPNMGDVMFDEVGPIGGVCGLDVPINILRLWLWKDKPKHLFQTSAR